MLAAVGAAAAAAAAVVAAPTAAATLPTSTAIAPQLVVDLLSSPLPPQTVLAVQSCAGLLNRHGNTTLAYTIMHPEDLLWLTLLFPSLPSPPPYTSPEAFVAQCLSSSAAAGRIRYSYSAQQVLVPLLLTAAGVLDAVPLEDGSPLLPPSPPVVDVVFDAIARWGSPDVNATGAALNVTADAFALFGGNTTGMAKMNPGYSWQDRAPLSPVPPFTSSPDLSLGDLVVANSLFNFYLPDGCIPGTDENALLIRMVNGTAASQHPWGSPPFSVLGYDDTWPLFGGDIFEAETTCDLAAPGMGQVASTGVNNLAFFSRSAAPVVSPLAQPPLPPVRLNASRTYVSFVVGDGDNIAYVKSTRQTWFAARASACAAVPAGPLCAFPLGWSLSPHLTTLAPGILRWYYGVAAATGRDYFVLPPSGHLYAYPALMPPATQAAFVAATETDAWLLNTSTTVEWEVMGTWAAALETYAPRYAARGQVKGLVSVNVPYLVPVLEFGGEPVKVVNGSVAVFAPFEWRGTTGGGPAPFTQNATAWAAQLNGMPAGSLVSIYLTSDGGASWQDFGDLAAMLGEHVEVVPPDTLAGLAGGLR
jgi:hypothetical protein